jgi:hypothetical protein
VHVLARRVESVIGCSWADGPREGLPVEVAGFGVVGLILQFIHLHSESGVLVRCLMFLGKVELALLLKRVLA